MPLPDSIVAHVSRIANRTNKDGFVPHAADHTLLLSAARQDPGVVKGLLQVLVKRLNAGDVVALNLAACLRWLNDFALVADDLRDQIAKEIQPGLLDFYADGGSGDDGRLSTKLAETLAVERPRHYFDLGRSIRINNGSLVIIGAGFSYDSYAPLLREMEGVACATLYDIGVDHPRELYHADEPAAWRQISATWRAANIICPSCCCQSSLQYNITSWLSSSTTGMSPTLFHSIGTTSSKRPTGNATGKIFQSSLGRTRTVTTPSGRCTVTSRIRPNAGCFPTRTGGSCLHSFAGSPALRAPCSS